MLASSSSGILSIQACHFIFHTEPTTKVDLDQVSRKVCYRLFLKCLCDKSKISKNAKLSGNVKKMGIFHFDELKEKKIQVL